MAKQVLRNSNYIIIPSLTMHSNDAAEYEITKQASVKLNNIKIDQKINSVSVDAILKLDDYTIALMFTAPHRKVNRTQDIVKNDKIGILEISLDKAEQWLYGSDNKGKYTQALKENIINGIECKSWNYHPRQIILEKRYNVNLNQTNFVTSAKYGKCVICGNNLLKTGVCVSCKDTYTQ